jgi:hypothetical protein
LEEELPPGMRVATRYLLGQLARRGTRRSC